MDLARVKSEKGIELLSYSYPVHYSTWLCSSGKLDKNNTENICSTSVRFVEDITVNSYTIFNLDAVNIIGGGGVKNIPQGPW